MKVVMEMKSPWYLWIGEFLTYWSYFICFNLLMFAIWQYFAGVVTNPLLLGILAVLTLFYGIMARPITKPDYNLAKAIEDANNQDEKIS